MKNFKIIVFYLGIMGLIAFGACKKYEPVPLSIISSDIAYDTTDVKGVYLQQRVNDIYAGLPSGFNRIAALPLDAGSDDAVPSSFNSDIEILSKSRLTATLNPDNNWVACYATIRNVNDYLANEAKVPADATLKKYFRAEVRFIRALNYFELIKRYGGVPLIGNTLYDGNTHIAVARNTYSECVQYIVSECDNIKNDLRTNNATTEGTLTGSYVGRVSRGAALALKARVLLYAASPLNNPTADINKWVLAAQASKDIISGTPTYTLMSSFSNLFVTRNTNTEVILGKQIPASTDLEIAYSPIGFQIPNRSYGLISPTQGLVDAFPDANGFAIDDAKTIYNAANPYLNRDPRLVSTVFFNGTNWLNRPVETFVGGKDNPTNIGGATRTGYYLRKFLGNFATAANYSNQQRQFPIFRYAEVLLNYAEAINEAAVGTGQSEAFNQLVALRKRAGIPLGAVAGYQYGLKLNMSQTEMRTAVRNERRIEMAFEEQRFWDIRRWKIAETVSNANLYGVKITKNTDGTLSYQKITVDKLNFNASTNYLYPIPQTEIVGNTAMSGSQNTGY